MPYLTHPDAKQTMNYLPFYNTSYIYIYIDVIHQKWIDCNFPSSLSLLLISHLFLFHNIYGTSKFHQETSKTKSTTTTSEYPVPVQVNKSSASSDVKARAKLQDRHVNNLPSIYASHDLKPICHGMSLGFNRNWVKSWNGIRLGKLWWPQRRSSQIVV